MNRRGFLQTAAGVAGAAALPAISACDYECDSLPQSYHVVIDAVTEPCSCGSELWIDAPVTNMQIFSGSRLIYDGPIGDAPAELFG